MMTGCENQSHLPVPAGLILMECEICGRREAVCLVYLEGAKMSSCAPCARGGKVHYFYDNPESGAAGGAAAPRQSHRSEDEIVEGYGAKIKAARQALGLSQEELGMRIAEKANYLEHVEREASFPSVELARKLEKFLKIKLVSKEETGGRQEEEIKLSRGKQELTLMDVAKIERGKKGK